MYGMIKFEDYEIRKETQYSKLSYYYKQKKINEEELKKIVETKFLNNLKNLFENNEIIVSQFYNEDIIEIKVPENIKKINEKAFSKCKKLKNVILPQNIKSIKEGTFYYCENLIDINIPQNVETIEREAFGGCEKISQINIPNSVVNIEAGAFEDCNSIKEITIPKTTINIREGVFAPCHQLEKIIVDKNNPVYDSRNNCNAIIETDTNTLLQGCKNTIIPE